MRWTPIAARWRRLSALLAVVVVAALGVFVGDRVVAGPGHDRDVAGADRDNGQDLDGAGDEEDGGPQAPADYLTLKWTSGEDVSQEQVTHAIQQAAVVPQGNGAPWSLVG